MVNTKGGGAEWMSGCVSAVWEGTGVNLPLRTKCAVRLCSCGISLCAYICKVPVSFGECVLTGLHGNVCILAEKNGFTAHWSISHPSTLTVDSIKHFITWFLLAKTNNIKVHYLFFNFLGQHPVVVRYFPWRGWRLLPPCAAYLFFFLSVNTFIQRLIMFFVFICIVIICKHRYNIEVYCVASRINGVYSSAMD